MSSYEKRIMDNVNKLLKKKGSVTVKTYSGHALYTSFFTDSSIPEYPFSYSVINSGMQDFHSGSIVISIKTSKKTNNLSGIQSLQRFLKKRLGKTPTSEELAKFIALYTIQHYIEKDKYIKKEESKEAKLASLKSAQIAIEALEKAQEAMTLAQKAVDAAKALVEANTIFGCTADDEDDWESLFN